MIGNAWIFTMYMDNSDGTMDYVMGLGVSNFIPASATTPNPLYLAKDSNGVAISDPTKRDYQTKYISKPNPAYDDGVSGTINRWLPLDATDIQLAFDQADLYLEGAVDIASVRDQLGDYQRSYLDRDIRME